jgi:NAD(P)-dependent dehydrogenase (short-subunit alcohol dehydrogenase family)/rhamnose utilization protein RhaD (predicted bifunctional aldolase and dehydrogenase)
MEPALRDLIRVSRTVGSDVSLVQGGGGNTSAKSADGQHMYIKVSGAAIKDIAQDRGWCRLNLQAILAILEDDRLAALDPTEREQHVVGRLGACRDRAPDPQSRPSVESFLHALLGRCVAHLHPTSVGAFVCAKEGRRQLERLFRRLSPPPLWIAYTDPGYQLARKLRRAIVRYRRRWGERPSIVFLQNHGLLVAAKTPDELLRLVRQTAEACGSKSRPPRSVRMRAAPRREVSRLRLAIRRAVFEATGRHVAVQHFSDGLVAAFLRRRDARKLVTIPALTPDEQVYVNGPPLWVDLPAGRQAGSREADQLKDRLERQIERGEMPAASFLVPGVGLFVAGTPRSIPTVKDIAAASLLVRTSAARLGGPKPLAKRQRRFIAQWEAEAFRRQVAGGGQAGELAERIAAVTGAGSGLGRSIAMGLARAGADVALLDVDLPSARETEGLIRGQTLDASTAAIRCDVTGENEVEKAFADLLDRWGGLDILVNAAGIAPPYALVDLPLEKWRATLEVNLTGYFLMARAAAKIMIQQAMGGSIINLSSKSGLDASRNNTPYNATKAGEIHMARGWALELGEHGIRVNSVAPGNVFEGSKIWSQDYLRTCAQKYGIKPEEVIPYYVNMTALKRRITGQDVADAVIFLCSDRARIITGQTLVPDGGQVMVR